MPIRALDGDETEWIKVAESKGCSVLTVGPVLRAPLTFCLCVAVKKQVNEFVHLSYLYILMNHYFRPIHPRLFYMKLREPVHGINVSKKLTFHSMFSRCNCSPMVDYVLVLRLVSLFIVFKVTSLQFVSTYAVLCENIQFLWNAVCFY